MTSIRPGLANEGFRYPTDQRYFNSVSAERSQAQVAVWLLGTVQRIMMHERPNPTSTERSGRCAADRAGEPLIRFDPGSERNARHSKAKAGNNSTPYSAERLARSICPKVPKFQSSIISHNSVVKPFHCCVREPAAMNSTVIKRSVRIDGHTTSVTLEDDFWNSLKEIAHQRNETVSQLIARIDNERKTANLSSVIRLFVLGFYQDQYNRELSLAPY